MMTLKSTQIVAYCRQKNIIRTQCEKQGLLEISKFWHYLNHFLVPSYFFGLRIGCRTRVFSFAVAFK